MSQASMTMTEPTRRSTRIRKPVEKDATVVAKSPSTVILTATAAQTESAILALPPELRNRIYEMALHDDLQIPTAHRQTTQAYYIRDPPKAPGLLLTCKQIYAEAHKIHYNVAIFKAQNSESVRYWLATIGAEKAALITDIHRRDLALKARDRIQLAPVYCDHGQYVKRDLVRMRWHLRQKGIHIADGVVKVLDESSQGKVIPPEGCWKAIEYLGDDERFF